MPGEAEEEGALLVIRLIGRTAEPDRKCTCPTPEAGTLTLCRSFLCSRAILRWVPRSPARRRWRVSGPEGLDTSALPTSGCGQSQLMLSPCRKTGVVVRMTETVIHVDQLVPFFRRQPSKDV